MDSKKTINFIAYIAVILIALSLLAKYILVGVFSLEANLSEIFSSIAYYLGLFVTVISAFAYAGSKRNNAFMVVLVAFLITLILFGFVL
ncbi:MAG: hypothetical protein EOM55_01735 [Clostridia bacterium]|nr:hypothetical protein [Clostridia bacterium]